MVQQKYDKTIDDMTRSLSTKPNDPQIYYRRGVALYLSKMFGEALDDFSKALENHPFSGYEPDIYYHVGLCYSNLEEFELSIDPFSKAIDLCKTEAVYFHERAKSYLLIDMYKEAVEDFNVVIKMQPYNPHAYFGRGFAWKNLREYSNSVSNSPGYLTSARPTTSREPRN